MLAVGAIVIVLHAVDDADTIVALQTECDAHARNISEVDLVLRACAVDLFEDSSISDTSSIRFGIDAYLMERWRNVSPSKDDCMRIKHTVFYRLPGIVRSTQELIEEEDIFLFNEHYIVKPSAADVEFGWHVDEDKQLGLVADDIEYVTLWVPLEEVSLSNGSLVFPSDTRVTVVDARNGTDAGYKRCRNSDFIERVSDGISLRLPAGSAVLFSSKTPHRSGLNSSGLARRVYYAQYSRKPITVAGGPSTAVTDKSLGDCQPLSFAVRVEPGFVACKFIDCVDCDVPDDES
jgi:ectoine hydroxylase-related dioxygenase (phytanoyl-CoA dioxygenase family)